MGLYKIDLKLRIVASLLFSIVFFLGSSVEVYASYTDEYTITAYYSPLPGQSFYITGSYDGDRKLNGNGTNGACGKQVYPGLIAAPSTFEFGTKIDIPGFGTGSVCDRGGAIQNKRLDIWLGFGQEGLERAMTWGKRTVSITIYDKQESSVISELVYFDLAQDTQKYIDMILEAIQNSYNSYGQDSEEAVEYFDKNSEKDLELLKLNADLYEEPKYISSELSLGASGNDVVWLQQQLTKFGYLRIAEPTGYFGEVTEHALLKFQLKTGIISDENDAGAGVLGVKTRSYFNNLLEERLDVKTAIAMKRESSAPAVFLTSELDYGQNSDNVKSLQEFLQALGYFKGTFISTYYGNATKEAVIAFQIDKKIISKATDSGAGRVGPKTLQVISGML